MQRTSNLEDSRSDDQLDHWHWEPFSRHMTLSRKGKTCRYFLPNKPDIPAGEHVPLSPFECRLADVIRDPLGAYFQSSPDLKIMEIMIRLRWVRPRNIKEFATLPSAKILVFPSEITTLSVAKFGNLGDENSDVFVVEESRNQHHSVVFLQPWKQIDALSFLNVPSRCIHSVEVPQ
ncbi:hypothetical protein HCU74_14265 [Spongiibacter sp. KMU-166]|uniref:RES domain protein n=1 Tax=Spongiibacter thalassae TaxID=2721624 RepID=A0ABX1GJE5_9GAMM|nr:hypothetical protein [Spongiibacter thalassae]NKI18577.1 hypothetical protein [Spongiibacter thalassae]